VEGQKSGEKSVGPGAVVKSTCGRSQESWRGTARLVINNISSAAACFRRPKSK